MKITIEISDASTYGLTPCYVYKKLFEEYWDGLSKSTGKQLHMMAYSCDRVAREQYAHETGRRENVKNLILTYADAENCFNLFKQYADAWAKNATK